MIFGVNSEREREGNGRFRSCRVPREVTSSTMTSFYQSDENSFAESCDCKNNISESMASMSNMSTHKRVEKRYDDIIKSQNDDRLYRGLVLANKMKVLLISDPTTDKSAVAMDVNT
ncbi:uncharacterized protein LOC112463752, partial [Temnothorax curvispinosus]|uniref:Uncharacterized protein LOC112463752 n=1 Tax=Temnothorax curvispinosus TaxID=300111 RepID=A0A6J1QZN0_9HYME